MSEGFFSKWKKGIDASTMEQQYQAGYRGNIVNSFSGLLFANLGFFIWDWSMTVVIVLFVFGVWQGIVAFKNYNTYKAMKGVKL